MKTINVATAFDLILSPGKIQRIPAGLQLVEDAVADHWYTKQHLAEAGVGTEQNVDTIWAAASVAWEKAKASSEAYEALVLQAREAEGAAGVEPRDPPHLGYIEERVAALAEAPVGEAPEPEPEPEPEADVGAVIATLPDGFRWATDEERGGQETYIVEVSAGARIATTADELTKLLALRNQTEDAAPAKEAAPAAEAEAAPEATTEAEAPADADAAAPEVGQAAEANRMDHDGDNEDGGSVAVTSDNPFDEMSDDELRAFITERDGKAPHHNAGRGKLLDIARKEDDAGE